MFLHAGASPKDRHELHEFSRILHDQHNLEVNWCQLVNRADGISEIEGKATKAFGASEQGRERVSNSPATPKQAKAGVSKAPPKKYLNSDDHFERSFAPYRNGRETTNAKERNNK